VKTHRLIRGTKPLLLSLPHMGACIPPDIRARMKPEFLRLPDADPDLDRLLGFAARAGAGLFMPVHARYVADLTRAEDDPLLVPMDIYKEGEEPDNIECINRIAAYWLPYQEALAEEKARLQKEFGAVRVISIHSGAAGFADMQHIPLSREDYLDGSGAYDEEKALTLQARLSGLLAA